MIFHLITVWAAVLNWLLVPTRSATNALFTTVGPAVGHWCLHIKELDLTVFRVHVLSLRRPFASDTDPSPWVSALASIALVHNDLRRLERLLA